jgi:cobalt-zinc-cadmium resistance protein CzcA
MVVDGAVVMVENIIRHIGHRDPGTSLPGRIRAAAHEVQRPVFYAIAIIITAYLPIDTLQSVEGRLFRPMAWTVGFALLGAMIFSVTLAPVLISFLFRKETPEWHNPVVVWLTKRYQQALKWSIHHRWVMVGVAVFTLCSSVYLFESGIIGSEFLPHLDEGDIWVRGTLPPSVGPSESIQVANKARIILASFPEVTQVASQAGRPDDATDFTGFFNTEYCVVVKPKEEWRPVFHKDKDKLIAAMNRELEKIPGVIWNFSQPIQDNMEEAMSGIKGQLATKIYGDDLRVLEEKGQEIVNIMRHIKGIEDLGLFRVVGQPNLNFVVDRKEAARYQINVADVQDAIQTAVGGNALTQVLRGEARYDLVMRYLPRYRDTKEAVEKIRLLSPSGERVSLAQLCHVETQDGATQIYREGNRRYVGIKYSVRGRDLGSTVEEAIEKVNKQIKLPSGYAINWMGEYESQKRADKRLLVIVPVTIFFIFMIMYGAFGSAKWAFLNLVNVLVARIGGLLALLITGTYFSVSSGVGFMALFGCSVQTGLVMVEYINQLRARGYSITEAAIEGATRRLRPIMMTMLVATLGLLPAAMSHAIGSDSQRPFAIVIVGGLIADLLMSIFLLPTFYVWWARPTDPLPKAEQSRRIDAGDEIREGK